MRGPEKNGWQNRRPLTRLAIAVAMGFVLCLSGCRQHESERAAAPPRDANVLLITLDTTRADHLSCYAHDTAAVAPGFSPASAGAALKGGAPRGSGSVAGYARTPHLDALAARGVRFQHATAQVPLTLPSHACLMTGEYPPAHGLRDMGGFVLEKSHPTLASIMQSAGFETAAFVGSRVLSKQFGLSNGFSTYDDDMGPQNEEGKIPGVYPERRASVVSDRAIDWLKQNARRKFFLWAHYYDPHAPYDPPEPYKRQYAMNLYDGEIAYTDEQVGRVLDALSQLGLGSRTLVTVIGDHGESLGEHGEATHGVFLYDSTLRVPFIMEGPDVPQAKVVEDQVRSIDVMPTLLEFLHLSLPSEVQGVSLWPLIQQGRHVRSNFAYLETVYPRTYMGWSELRATRTDQWKLIVAPHSELYNLQRDPGETVNLIAKFPAEADQLQKKVWEVVGPQGQHEKLTSLPIDAATRQELESLGYVNAGTPRQVQLGTAAPDPKDRIGVLSLLERSEQLMNRRAFAQSAQVLQQVLKKDPTSPLGHLYLAASYEKQGKLLQAIEVYEQAVKMNLATDQILSRLGKVYLRTHQLEKAVDAMTRASEINPTDLDNLSNLGVASLQLNRVEEAEKAFKAITLQSDHYAAAYNGLGLVAIQRGDADAARRDFEKAIEIDPDQAEPFLNLGLLYQKTGNKQGAIRYYERFLEKARRDQYADQIAGVREALHELRGGL